MNEEVMIKEIENLKRVVAELRAELAITNKELRGHVDMYNQHIVKLHK